MPPIEKPTTWALRSPAASSTAALAAAEQELRRALQYGFSASEIDREIKEWRAGLEDATGSAATRQSAQLAREILSSFDAHNVATHPSAELDRERLARFITRVEALETQLIVTALDRDSPLFGQPETVFHVEQGRVFRV